MGNPEGNGSLRKEGSVRVCKLPAQELLGMNPSSSCAGSSGGLVGESLGWDGVQAVTPCPHRFHMDPSGTFVQCDARAIGSASEGAQSSLQEVYHKVRAEFGLGVTSCGSGLLHHLPGSPNSLPSEDLGLGWRGGA